MYTPLDSALEQPRAGRSAALRLGALTTLGALVLGASLAVRTLPTPAHGEDQTSVAETAATRTSFPRLPAEAVDAAQTAVRAKLEDRAFPGAALAVGAGPRVERAVGMGRIGWRDESAPVSPDTTMYDLASLTKPVATATAVMLLAQDGKIRLDEPVRKYLPEFEGQFKDRVTWRHLLTHTSGLPGGAVIRGDTPDERLRRVLRTRIPDPPGREVEYTDLGYVALFAAAQRAAGEPLPRFLERRVWKPLGMAHTRFSPGESCTACAPTLRLADGEPFRGRPNDLLARRLGGVAGNAGLFSTAHDLARFAAMLANGGELDGVRVFRPETVREMMRQQPGAGRRTLGWVALCPDEPHSEEKPCARPMAIGHNGWTGTSLWMDPSRGVWTVLLTNRTYDVRVAQRSQDRWMQGVRLDVFRAAAEVPPASRRREIQLRSAAAPAPARPEAVDGAVPGAAVTPAAIPHAGDTARVGR